ncbi:hypothetical protein V202x_45120 [Gimesia aquarii]|uniref:Uncharacterized protein n=1 Tax=Gimesia aquarii TaxID=2527964 RepID=A0A517X0R2_9PLAN|nr:hypothetical protein V202x_45120 [Gimesia aquarii]
MIPIIEPNNFGKQSWNPKVLTYREEFTYTIFK